VVEAAAVDVVAAIEEAEVDVEGSHLVVDEEVAVEVLETEDAVVEVLVTEAEDVVVEEVVAEVE